MIQANGSQFKDEYGRTLMVRGVNLGGNSKVPFSPNGATYVRDNFFDHRNVSFVGRPFPVAEADKHFSRLKAWGLTFLRFLVTWEAIEHAGPGVYDQEYLDYVREIVAKAGEYGINMFIDPHQDVWSRFSGGDGAPGWTLEAVGLDMENFQETGAAIVHATYGDPFPRMIWPTNSGKLAAATMFTLFYGGNHFAPNTKVNGEPVQEYLQRHYINAILQVVQHLKDLPNVIGYDTMNEPLRGYIGWENLHEPGGLVTLGACPSPYQSMLLGAGMPQEVAVYGLGLTGIKQKGASLLNVARKSAWRSGYDCVWRQNGVWDLDSAGKPRLLRPDHFSHVDGRTVDFSNDYYRPFAKRFAKAIQAADPRALIFIETETGLKPPEWGKDDTDKIVFAPHWYDSYLLMQKSYSRLIAVDFFTVKPVLGTRSIRKSFVSQLAKLKEYAAKELNGVPTVLGEFGIPFDLDNKKSYSSGDFSVQEKAMDRIFQAIEANLLNCTIWNYTADNSNAHGDLWNDEDLSIFSRDQQKDKSNIHSGGRALQAVVRPYPRAIAGVPLRMSFDLKRCEFELEFKHDPAVNAPTELYVPDLQYPHGYRIEVSDGVYETKQDSQAVLYWHSRESRLHKIKIMPQV